MNIQKVKKITAAVFLFLTAVVGAAQTADAQTAPTVRIVLPERFRVITNQYFDLRVEAEGINRTTARILVEVETDNGKEGLNFAGPTEITTNNDSQPLTTDKAWTYRRVSFTTPGIKTIYALIIDGRRVYATATQISVQNFNLV